MFDVNGKKDYPRQFHLVCEREEPLPLYNITFDILRLRVSENLNQIFKIEDGIMQKF